MNDTTHEFLAILIDVNPLEWKEMKDIKFDGFMNHLFLYLKQMILSDCILPPCVLAYNQSHAEFIFPDPGRTNEVINQKFNPTNQEQIKNYFENIIVQIADFNSRSASIPPTPHVRLDVALSKSLCLMNNLPNKNIKKRILAFSVSPDTGSQYDNLLFAAKRLDVVIDVLFLNSNRLCFLSQAADLTHGFSKTIKMGAALAQYLFSLPPTTVRDLMALPAPEPLEYSAPSADTHKMISRGYICPVCLSILEEACRACPICNTRYGSVNFYINQTEFKSEELKNLL